jgi:ATP-dependent DNA helicase RecG
LRILVDENIPRRSVTKLIETTPTITVAQLARITAVSEKTIKRDLDTLKFSGNIIRHGPDKGGRWEVVGP